MEPAKLDLLREALPYIRRFKGKIFVVKFSGRVTDHPEVMTSLAEEIALCHQVGFHIVVVHGGGKQLNQLAEQLGVPQSIIEGRRVTDSQTLELAKMVLAGKVNTDILSVLHKLGVRTVGLSGLDGNIISAQRREIQRVINSQTGREELVDYGYVGDIIEVDGSLLRLLLEKGYVPVVSCLGADEDGNVYNINADTVASEIAVHLHADKLILLTNVEGVYRNPDDPTSKISRLSLGDIQTLLESQAASSGMIPKLAAVAALIQRGVKSAHIINGLRRNALLGEIFTTEGTGTMITGQD